MYVFSSVLISAWDPELVKMIVKVFIDSFVRLRNNAGQFIFEKWERVFDAFTVVRKRSFGRNFQGEVSWKFLKGKFKIFA